MTIEGEKQLVFLSVNVSLIYTQLNQIFNRVYIVGITTIYTLSFK